MKLFFDSQGQFIASEEGGRLYALHGGNIGHYSRAEKVFIDLRGRYLGEVVHGNRLLDNDRSPFRHVGFAVPGTYDGIGTVANPGPAAVVQPGEGFADIAREKLA